MLKIIGLLFVAAILVVLVLAATKPGVFRVARSIVIDAPPERIFPLLNDFNNFTLWSPYEKMDPDMQRTISNPASGAGASYAWTSKGKGGVGTMTIKKSIPASVVEIALDMAKPFPTNNIVTFTLEPQGEQTRVTWEMTGPSSFIAKVMQTLVSMDKMVGSQFEQGLADLKTTAEAAPAQ